VSKDFYAHAAFLEMETAERPADKRAQAVHAQFRAMPNHQQSQRVIPTMKTNITSLLSLTTRALLAAAALAAVSLPEAKAAVPAYGIDGNGNLRLILDVNTMVSVVLAPTQFFNGGVNVGLAIDPSGQLYAGDTNGDIYTLALNGTATLLGNPGLGPITGLDWNPLTNDLLVLSAGAQIFRANPVTGLQQGPTPVTAGFTGQAESIAWAGPGTGYVTFRNGGVTEVQRINLLNGSLLGLPDASPVVNNWTGVDIDQATGDVYMIGWLDDSWLVTGGANLTATHLATGNHLDWTALAILPTPEPGAAVLLLGAALAAGLRRRRRSE
jgi:hypothetical protein